VSDFDLPSPQILPQNYPKNPQFYKLVRSNVILGQILNSFFYVRHSLEKTLDTNVIAVHKVTSAFLPLLSKGNAKKIINISSTLGSMAEKDYSALAPFPSYKISKAALNMLTVQYSMELGPKGFIVLCLSPGWLQTDLGGSR